MESRQRGAATRWLAAALLLALSVGCTPSAPDAATAGDDAGRVDPDEIERLRALGYVGLADPLPPDAAVGVLSFDRERAQPGLNLLTNAHFCSAQLMDMEGEVLHAWSYEPCFRWGNAVLGPSGDLLVMGRVPHDETPETARDSRYLLRMDWEGNTVWRRTLAAHHDVDVTPDGRILTLTYELRVIEDVDPATPLRDNSLLLLSAEGETLEEVSLWELLHTAPELFTLQPGKARRFEGGVEIDALHSNSVEWMRHPDLVGRHPLYGKDTVLVCIRNQDTLAVFDWKKKKLVWAWGQGELSGPHDATMLENGNILVFDNGLGRSWSRVVEVDPLRREIVWEYRAPEQDSFYTRTRGANQRLANGNTLITESDNGRVFEVDGDHGACVARADLFVPALLAACRRVDRRLPRDRMHQ